MHELNSTRADALLSAADERSLANLIEAGLFAQQARADAHGTVVANDDELRTIQEAGERAWHRFVRANLGLVRMVAGREARRSGLPEAELFQEGCVALMGALQRYDHRRGCRFSTYAVPWIRAAVSGAAARRCGEINLPQWRAEALRRARSAEVELAVGLGRNPTAAEVGNALGKDPRWVAQLLAFRPSRSLDQGRDDGVELADPRLQRQIEGVSDHEGRSTDLLAGLPRLEREVLAWRYGFVDRTRHSYADVAARLGLGLHQVRGLEDRALTRLRRQLDQTGATPGSDSRPVRGRGEPDNLTACAS